MYQESDAFAADNARNDLLILVDGLGRAVGTATKMDAHVQGLLHRAFSVVLTTESDEGTLLLLSRRAAGKYHSAGLWANSCCSHPRAGEKLADAVPRRLVEELGCQAQGLREIGAFVYRAEFENGLAEYEYDHIFLGTASGEIKPDPAEVSETRWVSADELAAELKDHPERFAAWAYIVLSRTLRELVPPTAETVV